MTVLESSGVKKYEMFEFERTGVASIVMPVRHAVKAKVRFTWSDWGARVLTVDYPHGAPGPTVEFDRSAG